MSYRKMNMIIERRNIGNCKKLPRFEIVKTDFLASEFLPIHEEARG